MVNNSKAVYQHFRPEEREFIDRSLDVIRQVQENYAYQVTDFINPRQVTILESLVAQAGLISYSSSGYFDTEYAKVIVAPDYYSLDLDDFDIDLLELTYNSKFNHLSHRQIMGTLINQLGIKRSLFGDILLTEGRAQVLVERHMSPYFLQHVTKIGKVPVHLAKVDFNNLLPRQIAYQSRDILTVSWRVDAILSETLKVSRSYVLKLLEKDKVRLNYTSLGKASQELVVGDLLSVRGYGRFIIANSSGQSKSGKHKMTIHHITEP